MSISLAISPCPNDTFAFDAMLNGKIDTEGLEFNYILTDIENLNNKALNNETDIIKLSFPTFFGLTDKYVLLHSGSALGFGCGPLLISKKETDLRVCLKTKFSDVFTPALKGETSENLPSSRRRISDKANLQFFDESIKEIEKLKIAIPGKNTTANFLLNFAFPNAINKTEIIFSEIENAILNNKVDAGVIIHESRFTYQKNGLKKIIDLGEYWKSKTGSPIPLGGIAVKRNLPDEIKQKINRILKKSIEFAFANPQASYNFVKENAQQTDDEVIKKHIDLYVNKFTIDLGNEGRQAIEVFYEKMVELEFIDNNNFELFI
ncbi:MAG: 1,4-dihydroxy-6-naphthoate synthase [Bacteroidales bacterium]|jgi:1,4-dihydroxy-6-naphthoate synthase